MTYMRPRSKVVTLTLSFRLHSTYWRRCKIIRVLGIRRLRCPLISTSPMARRAIKAFHVIDLRKHPGSMAYKLGLVSCGKRAEYVYP